MEERRKGQKNPNIRRKISAKNGQKKLDNSFQFWYISQARPSESEGADLRKGIRRSEANLENDTEEENAQEGRRQRRFQESLAPQGVKD